MAPPYWLAPLSETLESSSDRLPAVECTTRGGRTWVNVKPEKVAVTSLLTAKRPTSPPPLMVIIGAMTPFWTK